jgi:hypothetical protein
MTTQSSVNIPPPASSAVTSQEIKVKKLEETGHVTGKVLIVDDRAVNLFSYVSSAGKFYADTINRFREYLNEKYDPGVSVSVLIAPTGAEFILNEQLKKLSASQQKAIAEVYNQLRSGVTSIDALTLLRSHTEEDLYFRTDHHWTATGAYYGYAAYNQAKKANLRKVKTDAADAYQLGEMFFKEELEPYKKREVLMSRNNTNIRTKILSGNIFDLHLMDRLNEAFL